MARSIKEIWADAYNSGNVKNVVWAVKPGRGILSDHRIPVHEDAMHINTAAELYHAADTFGKEIKRLRKVLVENDLAEYNSDGEFVEKFTTSTKSNINN